MYLPLGKESEGLRVVLTAALRRTKAVPSYHAELWHSSGAAALHSLGVGSELSLRLRSALIEPLGRVGTQSSTIFRVLLGQDKGLTCNLHQGLPLSMSGPVSLLSFRKLYRVVGEAARLSLEW